MIHENKNKKCMCEDMLIYYTIDVVSLIHVSITYYGHLHGGIYRRIYYKEHR